MAHGGFVRCSIAASVLMLAAGWAVSADNAADGHQECLHCGSGLPAFDIRLDAQERPTGLVLRVLEEHRRSDAWRRREEAKARLASKVDSMRVDDDPALGTVQFIRSPRALLTDPAPGAPRDIVMGFVDQYADLFGTDSKALADSPLVRDFTTSEGMMRHLTWGQTIDGVELFGSELRANVAGDGRVINAASTFIPVPDGGWNLPKRTLNEVTAIVAAAAGVGVKLKSAPVPTPERGPHGGVIYGQHPDLGNQDPLEVRPVYFARTREDIVPAWWVSVPERGVGNTYDVVVDATNGDLLWRVNRLVWETTQPVTYRVYADDSPAPGSPGTPTPSGAQFPFVSRSLLTIQPASIAPFSPNGWIPDGQNATVGNNVDAYNDSANDNTAAAADRATGASRVFDFPMNVGFETGDAPATYRNASITQLFYYANVFHDRLYAMGFNEAAGNFQIDNFGRGGVGGDPVRAESQDGGGTNNANFSTSGTDGSGARCQMYIFTGPNPDRDGSFDGEIVYHEMGHGLSIRLHRGGLNGTQGGGMGEGWSDFFGVCLNARPGDDFAAVYSTGGYATYNITAGYSTNYYYGIRRFPYSPDLTKNPLTFADIDNNQYNTDGVPRGPVGSATPNAVHNVGEVWCNTLLEARREIGLTQGFAANDIIMQLVVDGMKLAPSTPDFLDERDAILQADMVRYGGAFQVPLWRAFAKRGMGFSASSPSGGTTAGVVEAFDTPETVNFTYPDGRPSILLPGVATTFTVSLTPRFITITPGSAAISYAVNGGSFTSAPLQHISGDTYLATIPGQACFDDISYFISVDTSIGTKSDPAAGAGAPYLARVLSDIPVAFADDMETDRGWVGGQPGDTATSGQWQRADPQGTAAQPENDHTENGTLCWVTGAAAGTGVGSFDVDGGFTTLLSPVFNLAGQPDAIISYWRWYSNNQGAAPNADIFTVQISNNNGASWTNFEVVGPAGAGTSGGWIQASRRVGDVISPTATMRLRFIADDSGSGSIVEAAIDDVLITLPPVCTPPECIADFNQDGGIDGADVDAFYAAWEAGEASADVNADGGIDGGDVDAFFTVWEQGGC